VGPKDTLPILNLFSKSLKIALREKEWLEDVGESKTDTQPSKECTLSLSLHPYQPIDLELSGPVVFGERTQKPLDIGPEEIASLERRMRDTGKLDEWRFHGREIGKDLYRRVFQNHQEIANSYHRAIGKVKRQCSLKVAFRAPMNFLRLPLEFLFCNGDFLVLQHPMQRFVTGLHMTNLPLSAKELEDFRLNRRKLKILLIASNTGNISGVDAEIASLDRILRELLMAHGIAFEIDSLDTNQATYEQVRDRLSRCKYHLLHYAGHGSFDAKFPERSALYFWESEECKGEIKAMRAQELGILLRDSELRFVYLSCCLGAEQVDSVTALDDDFMGITDAMLKCGVPALLAFRWPVSDKGAMELAVAFYKSLFAQGELDIAFLNARRRMAEVDRDDAAWISPILVTQQ
jgi:hypothetical protein